MNRTPRSQRFRRENRATVIAADNASGLGRVEVQELPLRDHERAELMEVSSAPDVKELEEVSGVTDQSPSKKFQGAISVAYQAKVRAHAMLDVRSLEVP